MVAVCCKDGPCEANRHIIILTTADPPELVRIYTGISRCCIVEHPSRPWDLIVKKADAATVQHATGCEVERRRGEEPYGDWSPLGRKQEKEPTDS